MILSRNRSFGKEEPEEDAKKFIVFCEGRNREALYFKYFAQMDSRVEVQVVPLSSDEDNSPTGLFTKAESMLTPDASNVSPEIVLREDDEVWFIVDTDHWGEKLDVLYDAVKEIDSYYIGHSNPCFELWLYLHFTFELPEFVGMNSSTNWKVFLDEFKPGGFNSKKHPIYLPEAISNSKFSHQQGEDGKPDFLSTSLHVLGDHLYAILHRKIDSARRKAGL